MPSDIDRRRWPRRVPDAGEALAHVRVRTGREIAVLNVSDGGALVGGTTRLLPSTHVEVHVQTAAGRVLVRSRVVRACVSSVSPGGIQYHGALMFERRVETAPGYHLPDHAALQGAVAGSDYPLAQNASAADAR